MTTECVTDYVLRQRYRDGLAVGDRLRLRRPPSVEDEMDEDSPIVYRIGELWHVMVPFGPCGWPDDASIFEGSNLRRR